MPRTKPSTIDDCISAIKREVIRRVNTYPRLVKEFEMTQERADKQIAVMRKTLELLIRSKELVVRINSEPGEPEAQPSPGTGTDRVPYDAPAHVSRHPFENTTATKAPGTDRVPYDAPAHVSRHPFENTTATKAPGDVNGD